MIWAIMLNFLELLIVALFTGVDALGLPIEMIEVLAEITSYGAWIVGDDLILLFTLSVAHWLAIKMTVGIVLFVWRLLPFT